MSDTIIKILIGTGLAAAGVGITVAVAKKTTAKKSETTEEQVTEEAAAEQPAEESKSTVFTFVPEEEVVTPKFTTIPE